MISLFVDSGAYSISRGTVKLINIYDWIHWLNANLNRSDVANAVNMDVIGDGERTLVNYNLIKGLIHDENKQAWRDKFIDVYHLSEKQPENFRKVLERTLEDGRTWLGIGGTLGRTSSMEELAYSLEYCREIFEPYKDKLKIHLFGTHRPQYLDILTPDSFDTSLALQTIKQSDMIQYTDTPNGIRFDLVKAYLTNKEESQAKVYEMLHTLLGYKDPSIVQHVIDNYKKYNLSLLYLFNNVIQLFLYEEMLRKKYKKDIKMRMTIPLQIFDFTHKSKILEEDVFASLLTDYPQLHKKNSIIIKGKTLF